MVKLNRKVIGPIIISVCAALPVLIISIHYDISIMEQYPHVEKTDAFKGFVNSVFFDKSGLFVTIKQNNNTEKKFILFNEGKIRYSYQQFNQEILAKGNIIEKEKGNDTTKVYFSDTVYYFIGGVISPL